MAPFALSTPWRLGLIALATSLPVLALVVAFNALFLGLELPVGIALASAWLTSFVISLGIIILHVLADKGRSQRKRKDGSRTTGTGSAATP